MDTIQSFKSSRNMTLSPHLTFNQNNNSNDQFMNNSKNNLNV